MRFRIGLAIFTLIGAARADDAPPATAPITDPNVIPAQFAQPIAGVPGNGIPAGLVPDPPTPMVRVQVRVPSATGPGKELPYKIVVTNTSGADAFRVRLRNPIPEGVATATKVDPPADNFDHKKGTLVQKEVIWTVGTLRPGESKTYELVLKPAPDAKEVRNQAYVQFEHGQAVVTKIDKPKLAVRKAAPKQATAFDTIPVRVEVTNTGSVAIPGVQLVEDVSRGFEFAPDADGEKGTTPGQRVWNLGTLRPGEVRVVPYRLTARGPGELLAQSAVKSPDAPDAERAESTTKVLSAALTLDLKGPPATEPGEPALYEAVVTNTGTLPLSDVRVTAAIPEDCTVSKMTNGGQRTRDRVSWAVPDQADGPLKPGQSYTVRFALRAGVSGKRTVRVTADAGRGVEQVREAVTTFQGSAVLSWRANADPLTVPVGSQGLLTIRVNNSGNEAAKNTRLRVELPPGVQVKEASPRPFQAARGELIFDSVTIPANGVETFTLTFRPDTPGPAMFRLKLAADALGEQPLVRSQEVHVTGRGSGER
ncbi:MAG: hypothetical protein ACRC7O_11500 [Fimbriiglobus sp.]